MVEESDPTSIQFPTDSRAADDTINERLTDSTLNKSPYSIASGSQSPSSTSIIPSSETGLTMAKAAAALSQVKASSGTKEDNGGRNEGNIDRSSKKVQRKKTEKKDDELQSEYPFILTVS
jgi:hypothetical protein